METVKSKNIMLGNVTRYELNEAYNKVLEWFFSYPNQPISLNDLSESVKISKSTANLVVSRLEKEEFLEKEVLGKVWRITCNTRHPYNFSRKIAFNLKMVYESGIIARINKNFPACKSMVLFGSYRKGDDTEKSDIDLAVEVSGDAEMKMLEFGMFEKFGYRKKVAVNLLVFSRKKIDVNLFNNIANGIVVYGFLEVNP